MPEDITTPITKILLKENENLVAVFPRDIAKKPTYELYFFRVMRRYPIVYSYDTLPEIPAGGKTNFGFLGDVGLNAGNDKITIWEERPYRLYHFGIGVRPDGIRVYRAIPSGVPQTGLGYMEPTEVGSPYDYFDSDTSPYDAPTVVSETLIYHKLSFTVGLSNITDRSIKPRLKLLGAGYDTTPITEPTFINKILAGIKPARFVTIGGLSMFAYVVPREWEGKGVNVTKEEIERVMRGD